MKDPTNEFIIYGIIISLIGFIVVAITEEIGVLALGLIVFSGLFIATGLVFKVPFIRNSYLKPKQKRTKSKGNK